MNESTTVDMPEAPPVPGLRFRRFCGPEDYPGMVAANQAGRDAAGIEEVVSVANMANNYAHLVNCDLDRDLVIVERHGTIVGYARVEWRDVTDGGRTLQTVCLLHPDERGQGIGTALLTWQETHLRALAPTLAHADTRPTRLSAYTWEADPGATSLLSARGWHRQALGYEMVRPTLDAIPDVPLPSGIEVRPVGPADQRRIWGAAVDAFRDHRDEPEPDEADFQAEVSAPHQDPRLWIVAFDGDEIAGSVIGIIDPEENAHHGRARGLIDEVSTRRPWRRRGLARALIARGLVALREQGMTSAYLGVDGANPNQAMTLYELMGFEIASVTIDWSKPL